MMLAVTTGVNAAARAADIPGHYYLQAREMGSQLLLEPDSTFKAMIVYAGAQGAAQGGWKLVGNTLTLTSDAVVPPAGNLLFDLSRTRNLTELKDAQQPGGGERFQQAQNNYVLNLRYARSSPVPSIAPVSVLFEFNHGSAVQLLWNNAQGRQLYVPYGGQRTLTRIGFRSGADQTTQWFSIDPATRTLSLNWEVERATGQMTYEKPEELSLAQSQRFFRKASNDLALIEQNYIVTMNYGVPAEPPAIKPVDIFWSFDDGSSVTQRWMDSRQAQLLTPLMAGKTLKKLGVKLSDSDDSVQWFDVAADSRALDLMWDERVNASRARDLSGIFKTLELEVTGDCLTVDLGNGLACYRK
jgi:hypothetical protein